MGGWSWWLKERTTGVADATAGTTVKRLKSRRRYLGLGLAVAFHLKFPS
jgi:hypothetical protein